MLTDDAFTEGGKGYALADVIGLTPDQIYFCLCKKEMFKQKGARTAPLKSVEAARYADAEGNMKVRAFDSDDDTEGKLLKLGTTGESMAARLNRELEEEQLIQKQRRGRRKRRLGN